MRARRQLTFDLTRAVLAQPEKKQRTTLARFKLTNTTLNATPARYRTLIRKRQHTVHVPLVKPLVTTSCRISNCRGRASVEPLLACGRGYSACHGRFAAAYSSSPSPEARASCQIRTITRLPRSLGTPSARTPALGRLTTARCGYRTASATTGGPAPSLPLATGALTATTATLATVGPSYTTPSTLLLP